MDHELAPRTNVFKNKNFALLFSGVLVSNIAHILFNFAMSLYVLRIATQVYGEEKAPLIQGYYLLTAGMILVILMPFGGALADRFNKVKTMYMTDFIRGLTILGTGLLLYFTDSYQTKLVMLFVMAVILGVNSAFFSPASSSLLKFIVSEDDLQQASSYLNGSGNLQNIIGLILGGLLYASFGIYLIFLINGVAYIISAISEIFIHYDAKKNSEPTTLGVIFKDIGEGIKYVFNYKAMFVLLIAALFLNFFIAPIFSNAMPYFIEFGLSSENTYLFSDFMSSEKWYSVISLAGSVSGIIMALILSAKKPKAFYHKDINTNLIIFCLLLAVLGSVMSLYHLGFLGISITLIVMILLMFLMGFAQVGFNVPIGVTFQRKIDKEHLGKVQSVIGVLAQALIPISGLVGGILISQVSIVALYAFSIIGTLVVSLWYVANKNSKTI